MMNKIRHHSLYFFLFLAFGCLPKNETAEIDDSRASSLNNTRWAWYTDDVVAANSTKLAYLLRTPTDSCRQTLIYNADKSYEEDAACGSDTTTHLYGTWSWVSGQALQIVLPGTFDSADYRIPFSLNGDTLQYIFPYRNVPDSLQAQGVYWIRTYLKQ